MVINIQAFAAKGADNRRIYDELDDFQTRRPIDVISSNRPILILDEPQKMEGKATLEALPKFKPLAIFRYSATHKTQHNKIHRLDALDAYNQKLVKKIAVRGISMKGLAGMLLVSATRLLGIIDSVRNTILDWALTLEAEGIVGENLSFSDKEKAAASAIHINIGNAYNSPIQAGSISSSQIVNNLSYDIVAVKAFIEALEEKSNELELNSGQGSELSSEIQTIKAQIASPKPKSSIISASLSSIKTILEGAASSLTAEGLKKMIETLFT